MRKNKEEYVAERKWRNSQLQQRPVRVAVAVLLLALLRQVRLQRPDGLGVVPLEAIDDADDVVGPLRGVFAVHRDWWFGRKGGLPLGIVDRMEELWFF